MGCYGAQEFMEDGYMTVLSIMSIL